MHEFSIGQSLVDAVLAELGKLDPPPRELVAARVVVGKMRQIVPDYLQEAYRILTKGTVAEGSRLEISSKPIVGTCPDCGWQGEMPELPFQCRSCGSVRVDITGGMELYLASLEVEQDEIARETNQAEHPG